MKLSTILKNSWILILKVLSRTIFLFKLYKVNSFICFCLLNSLDEMLSEKYQKNKENLNLNQNKLPFSCYSYSIKPSAFMRNYNQKPQNFKFSNYSSNKNYFIQFLERRFCNGENNPPKYSKKICNNFSINYI